MLQLKIRSGYVCVGMSVRMHFILFMFVNVSMCSSHCIFVKITDFKIQFTDHIFHSFKVYGGMVFSIFTDLCHHEQSISEHFHDPKKKPHTH